MHIYFCAVDKDEELRIKNYKLQIENYELKITNYESAREK